MGECVWVDVDAALKTLTESQMGIGSAYETLKLQTIKATIIREVNDWKDWQLPAVAISGRYIGYEKRNEHPGVHYLKAMPYSAAFVVEGNQESVVSNAKSLVKRFEIALVGTGLSTLLVGDERTETTKPIIERAELMIFRKSSTQNDQWYGVAFLDFSVMARI